MIIRRYSFTEKIMTPAPMGEFIFYVDYKKVLEELTKVKAELALLTCPVAREEEAWQFLRLNCGGAVRE